MSTVLEQTKTESPFSPYPQEMDEYFKNNVFEIKIIPNEFEESIEKNLKNIKFTSAKQLASFLDKEIAFWKETDPKDKFKDFSKITSLHSAKKYFISAEDYYKKEQISSGNNYMSQCRNSLTNGVLYSKTTLAKFIVEKLSDFPESVINGFKIGILSNKNTSLSPTVNSLEGFIIAMKFKRIIGKLPSPSKLEIAKFYDNANSANSKYAELNARYTDSFHEHEALITSIIEKTNSHFDELNTGADKYFEERELRCGELERLYREKLRLEAPAEYWKNLGEKYTIKGRLWLGVSIVSSLIIVGILVVTLICLPNLFPKNSHWFEVFRNSAILTVMTSILVYMVRYFVKIAMSSFHLASDAKERENLSHFYLALIEKGAVSEKERAIVLNSLFSRSDSGLLKGDSSPTMSNTSSELIDILKNR